MLHKDFRQGQNGEPTAVKTLAWLLMGGSKREGENSSCNFIFNSLSNIDKKTQNFLKLELYRTLPNMSPELIPPKEKRLSEILQKTKIIEKNRIDTGLLWKKDEPILTHNRTLALNRNQSQKKFRKKTLPSSIANKLMKMYRWGMHASSVPRKSKHVVKLKITCLITVF